MNVASEGGLNPGLINPASPIPVYLQIEQDLHRQIVAGDIVANSRLPRETELAKLYGVSRMTVRNALAALEAAGLIRRAHGVGTIVTAPPAPVTFDLSLMMSFADQIRRQGHKAGTQIDVQTIATPTRIIRRTLRLEEGENAVVIRRVTLLDQRPVVINTSWLSARRFSGLDTRELTEGSLWKTLTREYGVAPRATDDYVELVTASADEARLLRVADGSTLIRLTGTSYDGDGQPIEMYFALWADSIRFHFSSRLP